MLNNKDFAKIVKSTPLVSIDLIAREPGGRVLIGLRRNEPARDYWFVPGGRIRKDERLDTAFARIALAELGVVAQRGTATLLGIYEHFYNTNAQEDPSYGTHYVVLGYELQVEPYARIIGDGQHSELKWCSLSDLLADPKVHTNTKAYFL